MKLKYFSIFLFFIIVMAVASVITYLLVRRGINENQECSGTRTYNESGLGIELNYPCSWQLSVKTSATRAVVTDPQTQITGPQLTGYEVLLKKGEDTLQFKKILIPIQASPLPIGKQNYEYVIIDNRFIRYKQNDSTDYIYAKYIPCTEVANAFRASDINAEDCASSFFESFGSQFPTLVTAKTTNPEVLKEIDKIIEGL